MHYIRPDDVRDPQILQLLREGVLYRLRVVHSTIREARTARTGGAPHAHDLFHIVLFSGGKNQFWLGDGPADCSPGTLVLCPPGLHHDFGPRRSGGVEYDEITFELVGGGRSLAVNFGELLSEYAAVDLARTPTVTQLTPTTAARLRDMIHRVTKEALGGSQLNLFRCHCALLDLMVGLGEVLGLEAPAVAEDTIERARRQITLRFSQPVSIVKLAGELGISPAHLSRSFRSRYGLSPRDYQQDLRLSAATRLLQSSSLSCKEVAARLGFADVQTFTKAFGRHCGRTPGAVARASRG